MCKFRAYAPLKFATGCNQSPRRNCENIVHSLHLVTVFTSDWTTLERFTVAIRSLLISNSSLTSSTLMSLHLGLCWGVLLRHYFAFYQKIKHAEKNLGCKLNAREVQRLLYYCLFFSNFSAFKRTQPHSPAAGSIQMWSVFSYFHDLIASSHCNSMWEKVCDTATGFAVQSVRAAQLHEESKREP